MCVPLGEALKNTEKVVAECGAQTKTLQNEATKELIVKGIDTACQLASFRTEYCTEKSERVCQ